MFCCVNAEASATLAAPFSLSMDQCSSSLARIAWLTLLCICLGIVGGDSAACSTDLAVTPFPTATAAAQCTSGMGIALAQLQSVVFVCAIGVMHVNPLTGTTWFVLYSPSVTLSRCAPPFMVLDTLYAACEPMMSMPYMVEYNPQARSVNVIQQPWALSPVTNSAILAYSLLPTHSGPAHGTSL